MILALLDPQEAEKYLQRLYGIESRDDSENMTIENLVDENSAETDDRIWCSKRKHEKDHEATLLFLKLRSKYASKFNDRKTIKSSLWQRIAVEMSEAGFYIGDGKESGEKCRQKFANLQRTYMNHITHVKKNW